MKEQEDKKKKSSGKPQTVPSKPFNPFEQMIAEKRKKEEEESA